MPYDPERVPTKEDCGAYCPGCGTYLVTCQAPTRPHWSGDGLAWDCPACGEPLHENRHSYVFAEDPYGDPPPRLTPGLVVRPDPGTNPEGDPDKPHLIEEE